MIMRVDSFDSLADYIATQTAKGDLAAVPIPLVAEHLNVSSPAVAAMLSDGRLDGVRIGKNTPRHAQQFAGAADEARRSRKHGPQISNEAREVGVRAIFYEPVMAPSRDVAARSR
ncbi:MAG: hypothetical protein WDN03_07290 [Rhizomicrobium sp.]